MGNSTAPVVRGQLYRVSPIGELTPLDDAPFGNHAGLNYLASLDWVADAKRFTPGEAADYVRQLLGCWSECEVAWLNDEWFGEGV